MTSKEFVLDSLKKQGKATAEVVQAKSSGMTATEIVAQEAFIPMFSKAVLVMNMLDRPVGFVVRTALGNVCKLLTVYDSTIYTDEPEEFPSMWGFQWSTDPENAKPFIALATSPYATGDCCVGSDDVVYRSTIDNNVFDPVESPEFWAVATSETSGDTLI